MLDYSRTRDDRESHLSSFKSKYAYRYAPLPGSNDPETASIPSQMLALAQGQEIVIPDLESEEVDLAK